MNNRKIVIAGLLGFAVALILVFGGVGAAVVTVGFICAAIMVMANYAVATYSLAFYVVLDYCCRTLIGGFVGAIWDEVLFIALMAIWCYKWIVDAKNRIIRVTPLDAALVVFYSVNFVMLFINSIDFSQSIEGFRAVVQHTLWYFPVVQLLRDKKDARVIYQLLILIGFAISLHGIYQYIIKVEMPPNWIDSVETGIRTRVYSIIGSPNILGSLMTLLIPMSVSLCLVQKQWSVKLFYFGVTGAMALCLVFTSSRGAWIGFMAAVFAYVVMKDGRLLIPAVLGALLVAVLVPSVSNRLLYMVSPEYIESSLRGGRLVRWIDGIEMVKTRPFLGLGLGQFGGAVAVNNEVEDVFYMDNYYLKTAVEVGLIGLAAFVVLMQQVFAWTLRAASRIEDGYYKELSTGAFAGIFGVIVHNFVENVFEVPMMVAYFWIITALVLYWYDTLPLRKRHAALSE